MAKNQHPGLSMIFRFFFCASRRCAHTQNELFGASGPASFGSLSSSSESDVDSDD